jgi:hypothetical protein
MSVSEKGDDGLVCGQLRQSPGPDGNRCESVKVGGRKNEFRLCKVDAAEALQLNNRRAKIRMSAELLRMGFSPEAVGRILNLELNDGEPV